METKTKYATTPLQRAQQKFDDGDLDYAMTLAAIVQAGALERIAEVLETILDDYTADHIAKESDPVYGGWAQ